ncbi:MAG TPA: Sir2 family NAD-dependent protein deacetylase [Polyangiaceae bacterium]|nr:Sir2 family NAD-dependent protein deacetylase [Polyangiaceae bacterium]
MVAASSIPGWKRGDGLLLVLTGAGISAESGIPTFRGAEGYWKVGSRNYRPMELATHEAFVAAPDDVWGWYLYRRAACRAARPNAAHLALAELERALGGDFLLVTQNVDGLHLRAGNTPERTYQIHGNIDFMRCSLECTAALAPIPSSFDFWEKGRSPSAAEKALLVCERCGAPSRPHVLWFDESYDEPRFRFTSSLAAIDRASMLVVVGTSGQTNLPNQICGVAARRRIPFVVVDPEPTPFSELALRVGGTFLRGAASDHVPKLATALVAPA